MCILTIVHRPDGTPTNVHPHKYFQVIILHSSMHGMVLGWGSGSVVLGHAATTDLQNSSEHAPEKTCPGQ
jgi:hypothetical protein